MTTEKRHSYDSSVSRQRRTADNWEDWEDDDVVTLIDVCEHSPDDSKKLSLPNTTRMTSWTDDDSLSPSESEQPSPIDSTTTSPVDTASLSPLSILGRGLAAPPPTPASINRRSAKTPNPRASGYCTARLVRLQSKRRQKAQNAKFGIKLITDMSKFRRQNHVAHQLRSPAARPPKFVDAAALRALEGSPNPGSVGNWNWVRNHKSQSPGSASPDQDLRSPDQELSPEDRPIVIGITLPSDEVDSHSVGTLTPTIHNLETPVGPQRKPTLPSPLSTEIPNQRSGANHPISIWSPDTPDTLCSFNSVRPASSIYSQFTPAIGLGVSNAIPPVPALPANYRKTPQQKLISLELSGGAGDDEDSGTPCTLFEEDGVSSPLRSPRGKPPVITPDSASSRSYGWWDHVVTPFMDRKMSFASRMHKNEALLEARATASSRHGDTKEERDALPSPLDKVFLQSSGNQSVDMSDDLTYINPTPKKTTDRQALAPTKNTEDNLLLSPSGTWQKQPQPDKYTNCQGTTILPNVEYDSQIRSKEVDNECTCTYPEKLGNPQSSSEDKHQYPSGETVAEAWVSIDKKQQHSKMASSNRSVAQTQTQTPIVRIPTPRGVSPSQPKSLAPDSTPQKGERSIASRNDSASEEKARLFRGEFIFVGQSPLAQISAVAQSSSPQLDLRTTRTALEVPQNQNSHLHQQNMTLKPLSFVSDDIPTDYPPPYSPPKRQHDSPLRYQAVFPPDHPLNCSSSSREDSGSASPSVSHVSEKIVIMPATTTTTTTTTTTPSNNGLFVQTDHDIRYRETSTQQGNSCCGSTNAQKTETNTPARGARPLFITQSILTGASTAQSQVKAQEVPVERSGISPPPVSSTKTTRSDDNDSQDVQHQVQPAERPLQKGATFETVYQSRPNSDAMAVRKEQDRTATPPPTLSGRPYVREYQTPVTHIHTRTEGSPNRGANVVSAVPCSNPPRMESSYEVVCYATPLPTRPTGTYLPNEHVHDASGDSNKKERERRRNEKEDVMAKRIGGFWRGRGCIPSTGCLPCVGRTGREGRQKRRTWIAVVAAIIVIIALAIILPVILTRKHRTHEEHSIWVNLTDYPPMPTGVLTFVGPDNTAAKSGCTEPSTLWSCSLPKDDHKSVAPYKPNQPTVVFHIEWDNSTQESWKVPNGDPPAPISRRGNKRSRRNSNSVNKRETNSNFTSEPSPPSFKEMWFLGDTTDNIKSAQKAGEPTPFYISVLNSVNDTIGAPNLTRRKEPSQGNVTNPLDLLPSPDIEQDGTPSPARMLPRSIQQPVRLFDRGLPTEHYGFYTYFKRTIFLKSVTVLNRTRDEVVPLDKDGGCSKTEADFLVTWAETRLLVQIWTRQLDQNSSSLLKPNGLGGINKSSELIRPGTMPYPVTVTMDTHGGNRDKKVVWDWPIDDRQRLQVDKAEFLANNIGAGGSWVNPRVTGDAKFGGFDGGNGGCKCEWVNWV